MLGNKGTWVGVAIAGATAPRIWFYQDFPANSGPMLTITANENGTPATAFNPAKIVAASAVASNIQGNAIYSDSRERPADLVSVTSHTGADVILNAQPDVAQGPLRIWYLYAASPSDVPPDSVQAPQFVTEKRSEQYDLRYLNAGQNLGDLSDPATARTNLGFSDQPAGRLLLADGGSTPATDPELFFKTGPNYLGIGSEDPLAPIHVAAAQIEMIRLHNTNLLPGLGYWSINQGTNGGLGFKSSIRSVPAVVLTNAGPVDIRTKLNVVNDADQSAISVRAFAGQLSLMQEWQASDGTLLAAVTAQGNLFAPRYYGQMFYLEDRGPGEKRVALVAPYGLTDDYELSFPYDLGLDGQFLMSNGLGSTSWQYAPTEVNPGLAGKIATYNATGSQVSDHVDRNGQPTSITMGAHVGLAAPRNYTVPDAGADADFVMAKGSQIITGGKDFRDRPTFADGIYLEDPAAGTSKIGITAPASPAAYDIVLPANQGAAGSSLVNDGAGNLTWKVPSSSRGGSIALPDGAVSIAIVFATPRASGNIAYTPIATLKNIVDAYPAFVSTLIMAHQNTGFTVEFSEPVQGSNNVLLWGTIEHANP